MQKKELDLDEMLDLKNCVKKINISSIADSKKMLVSLMREEDLKQKSVTKEVKNIIKVDGRISEESSKKLAFYYLKTEKDLSTVKLKSIIRTIFARYSEEDFQLDVESFTSKTLTSEETIKTIAETIMLLKHKLFSLKNKKKSKEEKGEITLITKLKNAKSLICEVEEVVSRVNLVKNFQILPPNIANSVFLAENYHKYLFKNSKIKVKILNKEKIVKKGMGLLLAVNRGSEHEPRLVVAEFNNNPDSKEKIALVGKGITFDSGGYNLKPSLHMGEMKFDMSGSAIVAGIISLVAALNLKINVVGLMPLTDNMIGTKAGTPDSVWKSYSGKTVEINNTDAEGRLVLADAMTYAVRDCKATEIITIATLTGAMLYCLGHTFTGYWSTKCGNVEKLERASKKSDELIWRMPFHDDFLRNFKDSVVADITNVNMKSKAGSSNAAMFLKEFSEDKPFVHFDIAGTAYQGGIPKAPLIKTLCSYLEEKFSRETKDSCKK